MRITPPNTLTSIAYSAGGSAFSMNSASPSTAQTFMTITAGTTAWATANVALNAEL
jgi:hypothetical protein